MACLMCRTFLATTRRAARARYNKTDSGCGVFGNVHDGFSVEDKEGNIIWHGKTCCKYAARTEAIYQLAINEEVKSERAIDYAAAAAINLRKTLALALHAVKPPEPPDTAKTPDIQVYRQWWADVRTIADIFPDEYRDTFFRVAAGGK